MSDEYFAPWLKRQLKRRDMKQADLARAMPMSSGRVSDWTTGKHRPSSASCERLAEVFGVPWDEVLAVAGHRHRDERSPEDAVRDELHGIIDRLPLAQLETLRPMLDALYQDARRGRLRRRAGESEATGTS